MTKDELRLSPFLYLNLHETQVILLSGRGAVMGHFWLVALLFGFCNILSIPVRYVFPFPGLTTLDEIEVKVQLSAHDWEPWVRMAPLSRCYQY